MAQKPTISEQDTIQFLQETMDGGISELSLMSGGDWSQAYSFVHDHKKYVLRWCHTSSTFEKDEAASLFSSEAMPIPQITHSGNHFDTYFAISEFAQGEFIDRLAADELDQMLPALFDLFDALRNTDLTKKIGYGDWDKSGNGFNKSWKEFLLEVNGNYYTDLANSSVGAETFDQLYSQFASLVELCPDVRELIHGDLLHYNLLVSDTKISALIDWQCSIYGDSLYDVAWFIYYEPYFPEFTKVNLCQKLLAHVTSRSADTSNLKARLLCYQLHIGLGSMLYNTFRQDWKTVQEDAAYALKLAAQANNL
jgi:hygromycin-B 4-O-kinase